MCRMSKKFKFEVDFKIDMALHKKIKTADSEHCFKLFARKRKLLEQTSRNNCYLQKGILRKDLDQHLTNDERKMEKG